MIEVFADLVLGDGRPDCSGAAAGTHTHADGTGGGAGQGVDVRCAERLHGDVLAGRLSDERPIAVGGVRLRGVGEHNGFTGQRSCADVFVHFAVAEPDTFSCGDRRR